MSYFVFLKLISINVPLIPSRKVCLLIKFQGISSLKTLSPYQFLSRIYGGLKASIINYKSVKLESHLVSVLTKISSLFLIISFQLVKRIRQRVNM